MPGKASLALLLLLIVVAGLALNYGVAGLALNYLSVCPGTRHLGGWQLPSMSSTPPISTLPSPTSSPTSFLPSLPHLYLVTPTYTREEQEAELTR